MSYIPIAQVFEVCPFECVAVRRLVLDPVSVLVCSALVSMLVFFGFVCLGLYSILYFIFILLGSFF